MWRRGLMILVSHTLQSFCFLLLGIVHHPLQTTWDNDGRTSSPTSTRYAPSVSAKRDRSSKLQNKPN